MSPEEFPPAKRAEDQKKTETPADLENEPLLPFPDLKDTGIETYVHENRVEMGFEGAKDRVLEVLKIVKEDEKAVEMINETLASIFRYVETIYTMEVNVKMLAFRWEGDDLAERIERHDKTRRRAHDALIATLNSTTRYLNENFAGQIPQTGIYTGDPTHLLTQNRAAIGDWAIELEHEILLGRAK